MEITEELIMKLRAAKSKEAFAGILAENKIELTAEEVDGWYQHESTIAEMPDEELAQVTGGGAQLRPNRYEHGSALHICDHRERGTCSVPRNVCSAQVESWWAESNKPASVEYALRCPKFMNNYQAPFIAN